MTPIWLNCGPKTGLSQNSRVQIMKIKSSLLAAASVGALFAGVAISAHADDAVLSGRIYYDITNLQTKTTTYVNGAPTTSATSAKSTGIDVKRFYVGIDKKFSDTWSMSVTTDFEQKATVGRTAGALPGSANASEEVVFVKKAYFQGKFDDALVVKVGASDMPWVPYMEGLYGYRYVEQVAIDRLGLGTSTDWGVHVSGDFGDYNDAHPFQYQVSLVNGAGYRDNTRGKQMDIEGRFSAKFDQWNLALGGYQGKLGSPFVAGCTTTAPATPAPTGCAVLVNGVYAPALQDAKRIDASVVWVGDRLRIGAEYFNAHNWKVGNGIGNSGANFNTTITLAGTQVIKTENGRGMSYFGSYRVTPHFTVFGKVDSAHPTSKNAPAARNVYKNLGVEYTAFKNINFSLVWKNTDVKSGSAAGLVTGRAKTDEIGLFAQARF